MAVMDRFNDPPNKKNMDAKELRIGNWINYRESELQVKGLHWSGERVFLLGSKNDVSTNWKYIEEVKPIPLDEEWLLKFGFDKDESQIDPPETLNGNFWADYKLKGMEICMPFYEFIFSDGESSIEVKTIHQLQNLFYALTGEELTIK